MLPPSKVVDAEDFAAADLRPYLKEILGLANARVSPAADDIQPDGVLWQEAMALRALDAAGIASPGRMVAVIGAGTNTVVFALARRGAIVFAADRYLQPSAASHGAPVGMLVAPERYSSGRFPRGHVLGMHSRPTRLNLPSDAFDGVVGLGVMEHLGSLDDVAAAAREIGRILKPGGVASIATEFRLDGPDDRRWFDDRVLLFSRRALEQCIVEASGLTMRTPLSTRQSDATFETRRQLADFEVRPDTLQALAEKRAVTPNLVLYHEGFLFCPVMLTLHKDGPAIPVDDAREQRPADDDGDAENASLAAWVEQCQRTAAPSPAAPADGVLLREIERLRAEADWLRAAYDRSNAWKRWRVMRPARFIYQRVKRWRE